MLGWLKAALGLGGPERQQLTDTEMMPNQDYRMAQSFSGDEISEHKDGASETTSLSRSSSYQKLNEKTDLPSTEPDPEEAESEKDQTDRSSWPCASFNVINSIIGAGVIGTPYAIYQAGLGMGIILIIGVGILTDYSIILLIQGGSLANTNTYQGLVNTAFGKVGFLILTTLQFLYPFIAMISYNIIVGDTATAVILRLGGDTLIGTALGSRQFIIVLFNILLMLPLSLYKDIAKLSKASVVGLIFIFFIIITILIKAVLFHQSGTIIVTEDAWDFAHGNFFQSFGIISFAYMCHHNSFMIYTSLENPSPKRWNLVTHTSVATSCIIMLLIGIIGYITFTGNIQGDFLLNYCARDDFINVARFAYAMTIVLTYPLECFVTREVVENSIFATKEPQLGRHILVTVIIVILACGISMATDCLGIVLELNGALAAIPLAFIFPPLCVLKLQQEPILSQKSIPKIIVVMFGIISSITAVIMTIMQVANGRTCSHGIDEQPYCHVSVNSTIFNTTSITMFNTTTATMTEASAINPSTTRFSIP